MNHKWIIWSIEHQGWWKDGERGYTEERSEAGVYSFEKALEIVHRANIRLDDEPNEAMVPWVDMSKVLKGAKEIEESDLYDARTAHEA